jgi:uncharacterized membrane protein YqjE
MTDPATRHMADNAQASVGDLVALVLSDVSQLVKCELDLAKMELKSDARRLGVGGALLGVAAFVGCLVLILLSFAFAYGLITLGIWDWAAFLIVAGTYVALAGLAVAIGFTKFRGLSGLRETRSTVAGDLALIRRDDTVPVTGSAGAR